MKKAVIALAVSLSLGLSGCYKSTHLVQKNVAPTIVKDATVSELAEKLDGNYDAMKSFSASVTIAASTGGGHTGHVTDYTAFKGYILMRKPRDLRVILQVPFLGSVALEMVSDGKNFKLVIPSQNKARVGTDEVKVPSKNSLENLRPGIFFDSILVRGVGPDELVTVTDSERVVATDPKTHESRLEPDYDLVILGKPKDTAAAKDTLTTRRVVHYNRETLLPYKQDMYDEAGRVVTTVNYSNYQKYGDFDFPSEIDIARPFDEYALKITFVKFTPNQTLDDEQFKLEIPAGMTVQNMDLPAN